MVLGHTRVGADSVSPSPNRPKDGEDPMIETLLGKFTAAGIPAKAGLAAAMLTLATVGAAAAGVLPAAAEEVISDAVEDATGIELPDSDATEENTTEETTTTEEGTEEDGETD